MVVTFDPSAPGAARWRAWLDRALDERGVPPDAELAIRTVPHGGAAIARLVIELWWQEPDAPHHARAEVLVPLRRVAGGGCGWSGWQGYLAGVRLLRALG